MKCCEIRIIEWWYRGLPSGRGELQQSDIRQRFIQLDQDLIEEVQQFHRAVGHRHLRARLHPDFQCPGIQGRLRPQFRVSAEDGEGILDMVAAGIQGLARSAFAPDPVFDGPVREHQQDMVSSADRQIDRGQGRSYATINLVHYLRSNEKIMSVSVVQTGDSDDFMTMGEAIGEAVSRLDRRVVVLASGGMSHRFWPLKQIAKHEASDPVHIITPEARAADEERLEWMKAGDHARIVDTMDEYFQHSPEGGFGHYLMMLGAIGGRDCTAPGELFSDYENATGTGQVHVWFDRPDSGWIG